ncbi:MAG: CHAP domain-containing protein, partial [Deltaproteobacteria bacterium]|nr:CHAP domain-containing protein [Deltaproteobacteria bacterium]
MLRLPILGVLLGALLAPSTALAVGWCGGVSDSCQCGADNPYPCCDNGYGKSSNCTWGAWHMACCNWGKALPAPWQHAKYWAGNYAGHPDYEVHGSPSVGAIGCRASGSYGHVAYVTGVNGGNVTVHEQSCCEGSPCWPNCSWCINGFQDATDSAGYFDGGYITTKGAVKVCGDGKCNNGENCASCPGDCGGCCGNGACDNGENCASCAQDCGGCCGNGACDNGENCASCPGDCGQCCGNGACDFGESCSSCEKDCGICNEPPDGELEIANCQQLVGWARDIDVEWPIGVDIRANGNSVAQMTADQQVSSHPGQGFSLPLGHEHKDGNLYAFEVIGKDDKGLADTPIAGSGKQVLCRNGVEQLGIWTLQYQDAAGVEIAPVEGDGGWTDLKFYHPEGLGYPTSGVVLAAADISTSPFVRVSAELCGGLVSPLYEAAIGVDGDSLGNLSPGPSPCIPVEYQESGKAMTGSLLATGMEYDGSGRDVVLKNLSFWSRGWRFGYSWDSSGLLWGSDAVDRIAFTSRQGAVECRGYVAAARQFAYPFQGVEIGGKPGPGSGPKLTLRVGDGEPVDLEECLATQACTLSGKDGESDRLEIRLDCGAGEPIDGTLARELRDIRVFRGFV